MLIIIVISIVIIIINFIIIVKPDLAMQFKQIMLSNFPFIQSN